MQKFTYAKTVTVLLTLEVSRSARYYGLWLFSRQWVLACNRITESVRTRDITPRHIYIGNTSLTLHSHSVRVVLDMLPQL